jgi:hypothetical protein
MCGSVIMNPLTAQGILKNPPLARRQWLTPVILAIWEAEIRRLQGQPRQIVLETLSPK